MKLFVRLWRATSLGLLLVSTSTARAEFRAGVAVRVVTPDPLLPVSGGIGPSLPVSEKRGDLTVRAVVLEQGPARVAIVSADFLGFPSALGDRVRSRINFISPTNILIGATHTHSAPDCYGFPDGKDGFSCDLSYLDHVVSRMSEAIIDAFEHRQPAALKIATGEAHGKIAYNYYAPDLFDPRCHVIQILNAKGIPQATIVNYAIHPEVLGSRRGICSPDLIGPLYERLTANGGGVGVFMNSAQGGMVTADVRRPDGSEANTWEECVRIGQHLADEALRIVDSAPVQNEPSLAVYAGRVEFPVESDTLRAIIRTSPLGYRIEKDSFVTTTVNLVNLGDSQILTIPGEALPNIGYYLKRKMRGKNNLLFGLTNDAFGYILTAVDWGSFSRYNYVSRTCLGERTGEIYIAHALGLVTNCPPPAAH